MAFTIATWNINSIRARLHALTPWLAEHEPDVVCLQETKVQDHDFPKEHIESAGYRVVFRGEKSYNGVAILSKAEIVNVRHGFDDGGPADEARLIVGDVGGVTILNTYVPQGREPDHPMFAYKLEWFARLRALLETRFSPDAPLVWVGDLNVAPTEIDVWDPERLLGHVCFNPEVSAALERVMEWGLFDVFRKHVPDPGHYTYYDYRATDGVTEGKGWRIDHVLATGPLLERSVDAWIDLTPRTGPKPSDHAPLVARFGD
jgi:exodeoxyribonuclease-3